MKKNKLVLILTDICIGLLAALFAFYMVLHIVTIVEQRTEEAEPVHYASVKAYDLFGQPLYEWEGNLTAEYENGLVTVSDDQGNTVALYGCGGVILE